MNPKVRVSIGMPLYNAEASVARALDALLAQTFSDFEIVVSDNASTDKTAEIVEGYASRDGRIRLYRNDSNIGMVSNFQRVFDLAQGEYFLWAAHDDSREPQFLEACVNALDQHPDAVLAFPGIRLIRPHAGGVSVMALHFNDQPPEAWQRIIHFLKHPDPKTSIFYGVYRRSLIEKAGDVPFGLGADIIWLLKCVSEGSFVQVEPVLFITHIARRSMRSRVLQHTGGKPPTILTLMRLDWLFIRQLFTVTQRTAPHLRARLRLFWAFLSTVWLKLGWPLSPRLFIRYAALFLPEKIFQRTRKST